MGLGSRFVFYMIPRWSGFDNKIAGLEKERAGFNFMSNLLPVKPVAYSHTAMHEAPEIASDQGI